MNAPFSPSAHHRRPDLRRLAGVAEQERPEHDARLLTGGGVEARILLDGTAYVLRITRLGKLILTK